jgi:ATP-dependent Clp protease ATP-binding subunit ClpC
MSLQHLDAHANAVVKLANDVAREYELDYVGTEHILLALARHGGGGGAAVLKRLGGSEAQIKRELDALMQAAKEDTWVFGRLPGTPHYRNVIALAIDEATQLEAKEIGTEHLLLGLLREKGSLAQLVLEKLGVTLPRCRQEILKPSRK